MDIRLGLCCLNTELREQKPPIFMSRSMILKTFRDKGTDYAKELSRQNMLDILSMLYWNRDNGINVMRLSSNIFPHISSKQLSSEGDADFREYQNLEWAKDDLKLIGNEVKKLGHRVTFHPGQYNQIGAPDRDVFESTILDLGIHAKIFDLMDTGKDSVMVIHGGGVYKDKTATIDRWKKQFMEMPEYIRDRVVFENCERAYSVEDALPICEYLNIPMVYDTHHYSCYTQINGPQTPIEKLIPRILHTWTRRGIRPKMHISEQGSGRIGHHSDYVEVIPDHLLEIPDKYGMGIDIMIEAKMKEKSIFHLHKKYPHVK